MGGAVIATSLHPALRVQKKNVNEELGNAGKPLSTAVARREMRHSKLADWMSPGATA